MRALLFRLTRLQWPFYRQRFAHCELPARPTFSPLQVRGGQDCAVVTKDVAPFTIADGNPAQVIGTTH